MGPVRLTPLCKDDQLTWAVIRYHGLHDPETSVTVYYAVPYAQAKRFEAPRPIDTVDGLDPDKEVNATAHGAACPNFKLSPPFDQAFEAFLGPYPAEPQSEDCLNLDVYVPDGNHDDLPVLFFAPGGGFLVGASWPTDMRSLVSRSAEMGKPFIGVAIQYRLGPLGTLNPSTAKDVNVGVLDQFEALRFINKYAGVWGGSGKKVTISEIRSTLYQIVIADMRPQWVKVLVLSRLCISFFGTMNTSSVQHTCSACHHRKSCLEGEATAAPAGY